MHKHKRILGPKTKQIILGSLLHVFHPEMTHLIQVAQREAPVDNLSREGQLSEDNRSASNDDSHQIQGYKMKLCGHS